jgi:imidazolonepropionase-like amidohydrolase
VIASGADWVKMRGSTGGFDDVTQLQTFTFEEMKAAVDASHALGKKIAIHSYGPAGARDAVRAGVDSLEHGADLEDETIAEMVRRNTYYAPTIDHNQYYVENADTVYHFPAGSKERLRDYIRRNVDTAQKAFRAGVRIIMGSDAVYNGWGLNTRELDWFVKIGMTPEQALKTATTTPAAMLGMEKSLGAVAPGVPRRYRRGRGRPVGRYHRNLETGEYPLGDESRPDGRRQGEATGHQVTSQGCPPSRANRASARQSLCLGGPTVSPSWAPVSR